MVKIERLQSRTDDLGFIVTIKKILQMNVLLIFDLVTLVQNSFFGVTACDDWSMEGKEKGIAAEQFQRKI